MNTYVANIEADTIANPDFRRVVFTAEHCQVVLMSLKPGEDIGLEVHELDQFFRFEAGAGKVVLDGKEHAVSDGSAVVVPAGVEHNVINDGTADLKLYTIYAPPEHKDGTRHATKAEAEADHDHHFNGKTSV